MRAIALFTLLVSASAIACPDLSGKWASCKSQTTGDHGSMEMSQSTENGMTIYRSKTVDAVGTQEDEIIADGIVKTSVDEDGVSTVQKKSCEGNKLVVSIHYELDGQIEGATQITVQKKDDKLITKATGKFGSQTLNQEIVCE